MSEIVNWKIFLTQFLPKCKADYVVYGDGFPSLAFLLPEEAQNKYEYTLPVRFAIPAKSNALGQIMEALPSVIDVDFASTTDEFGLRDSTFLVLEKAVATNEENIESQVFVTKPTDFVGVNYPVQRSNIRGGRRFKPVDRFKSHINFTWRFMGRYSRQPIQFYIEKWKDPDIESICKAIYTGAPHSAFIPLVKNGDKFVIPGIFSERYSDAMNSVVTILKPTEFSTDLLGGYSQWIKIQNKK